MYYNSNQCNRYNGSYENQLVNSEILCCYPEGWYCDVYQEKEEKQECFCKNENKYENLEQGYYDGYRRECGWKQQKCFEKEHCFNYENNQNKGFCNKQENKNQRSRRCCLCNLFNCFGRRN